MNCQRCLADSSFEDLTIFEDGTCNYCRNSLATSTIRWADITPNSISLDHLVASIKQQSKHSTYDCIVGISGGVDSSYVLIKAIELGLKPYVVHMNNTWNDGLADLNISRLIKYVGLPLHVNMLNASEYDTCLLALMKANVVDLEILYDNAAFSTCYRAAEKLGLRYILGGQNYATEGYLMPKSWNWFKYDKKNILSIVNRFYPALSLSNMYMGTFDYLRFTYLRRIQVVPFLDFFDFSKNLALNELQDKFSYVPYPYKHYESRLTRFYQAYILPMKFGIDKRRGHLSSLILNGELTREEAISMLSSSPYDDDNQFHADYRYFISRLGIDAVEFESYISKSRSEHIDYPSEYPLWRSLSRVKSFLK